MHEREQWVLGFLSGIGFSGKDYDNPLRAMDDDGVWGWIDIFCKARPLTNISQAAEAFYHVHPR